MRWGIACVFACGQRVANARSGATASRSALLRYGSPQSQLTDAAVLAAHRTVTHIPLHCADNMLEITVYKALPRANEAGEKCGKNMSRDDKRALQLALPSTMPTCTLRLGSALLSRKY